MSISGLSRRWKLERRKGKRRQEAALLYDSLSLSQWKGVGLAGGLDDNQNILHPREVGFRWRTTEALEAIRGEGGHDCEEELEGREN